VASLAAAQPREEVNVAGDGGGGRGVGMVGGWG